MTEHYDCKAMRFDFNAKENNGASTMKQHKKHDMHLIDYDDESSSCD